MPLDAVLASLQDYSLFGGIPVDDLTSLADLFETAHYPAGTCIVTEGEMGNRLYVITSGRVEVRAGGSDPGSLLVLATLEAGDSFGEMELIDTQPRSATVAVLEATETVELTNMGFLEIYRRDPDAFRMLIMNIARELSRRLRAADRELASRPGPS